MTAIITSPTTVTAEQIAKCSRVIDMNTMHPFYLVESESDFTKEYKVAAIRKNGAYHLTCSCPAGLCGIPCKHRRWALAAADQFKADLKVQAQADGKRAHLLIVNGKEADDETYKRVMNAKPAPTRNVQAPASRAFSLLK